MAARYGHLINKWTVAAVAALAVMAALLAAALPVWAQDAPPAIPDAQTLFNYAEKGTGPVTTYRARDPENKPVFWTLGGPDAADFTIVGGALRFKSPPDFEVPTDRANDENGSGGALVPVAEAGEPCSGEGACNNIYKVTVRFGAGGEDGTPGEPRDDPADEYDGDDLGKLELTVTVTNVNEPGMVVISPMQPQIGTELTAILTDEDNIAPGEGEWQWASSNSMTGTFTNIPSRSNDETYRPTADDLSKYLRVTVEYVDRAGADLRTVQRVSAYPVRQDTNTSNQDPKYPDQSTLIGVNGPTSTDPTLGRTDTDRFIPETAAAGTRVGAPVTAFDDKTDIEVLTYSLRDGDGDTPPNGVASDDDGNTDTPVHNDGHAASFDIDAKTGQITVGASAMLDADGTDGDGAGATNPYNVVVRVVDGDGHRQDIDVAIHVLKYREPPMIDRIYAEDRVPATGGVAVGDRVPTEFSHWESDRTPRSATRLDADLESGVLNYPVGGGPPTLKAEAEGCNDGTTDISCIQPATYYATDEDTGAPFSGKWTLEGDDAGMFFIYTNTLTADGTITVDDNEIRFYDFDDFEDDIEDHVGNTGPMATLSFKSGPDFEEPGDKNKDNVYEVTIVVTDGTVDMNGDPHKDELPVTVKVINSAEDNKPGEVMLSNRVPEVAIALTATLDDDDKPVREVKWQWYRLTTSPQPQRERCANYTPSDDPTAAHYHRAFISDTVPTDWEKILNATSARYTPGYDEDSGGMVDNTTTVGSDIWTGGDIDVTITTDSTTGDKSYSWSNPKCLRATVTYRDAVDRTHAEPNDNATDVDETLEGTFMGSEFPVKPLDEKNDAPVFLDPAGNPVSVYRADDIEDIAENTTEEADRLIKNDPDAEDLAAIDPAEGEDDVDGDGAGTGTASHPDILTYTLSGRDAGSFTITGTIDTGGEGAYVPGEEGVLHIKAGLDFEAQSEYKVRVKATDPSGDSDFVDVTVNITDVNEPPKWTKKPGKPVYAENGTGDVALYLAKDPEGSGVTYSLVTAAVSDPNGDGDDADDIEEPDITDRVWLEISSTRGILRFKASPNYEDPKDGLSANAECDSPPEAGICNNMYQVTVKAEVADDVSPRDAIYQEVTVEVINIHEAPVFPKTTDTLEIWENPDDPEKEPTSERGYLYLLNRGVGKPAANLPAEPNLDVGIPMVAVDDDNTFTIRDYTGATYGRLEAATNTRPTQLIDGLTYELSGADAGPFHIVPATGQILTGEKLDYETKKTYKVTVKATDPWGLSGSIPVTINVDNVDEAPVGGLLTLGGLASHDYAENNPDTSLGIYTVSGATAEVKWTLEGADASHFELDDQDNPQGGSRMLKFARSPNYEMPRGQAMRDTNTNAYMVTVKVSAGDETETVEVTVMVTNVEEAGTVTLSSMGGKVGTPLTAVLSDDDIVVGAIEWQWYRVNPATGSSDPITGARNSSYTPVAADVGNHLMVTATYTDREGAGKSASERITTAVADTNAAPEFAAATDTRELAEDTPSGTPVGGPITATDPNGDNLTYMLSGGDAMYFTIDDMGQIMVGANTMLDYETKMSYMVTVRATDPEGLSGSIAVTVNVTNVDESGMVSLSPARPSVGTPITASVTDPDSSPTGETYQWSYSTAMDGTFTPYPAEIRASFNPTAADVGRYLRVTVSYNDVHGAQTEIATTEMAVILNVAPAFSSETATRSVAENTAAGMNIGAPVMATDGNGDTLSYMLSGDDAMYFTIDRMGQIKVGANAMLDYETKMSYMVTVTANDPAGASGSIMVTIMVTDANEEPSFPSATATRSVAENTAAGMNVGAPVMAMDDDNDTLSYMLSGGDAIYFTIDGMGQIKVGANAMLDYETKMSYMVTVTATDPDGASGSIMVTIMVTDVDEVDPVDPVVARYDTNENGTIEKSEVIAAINDYLFGTGDDAPSKAEVIRLINLYLFG